MDFPYRTLVQWGRLTETNKQLIEAEIERLTQQNKTDGQLVGTAPARRNWATQEDAETWTSFLGTLSDPPEDIKIELNAPE